MSFYRCREVAIFKIIGVSFVHFKWQNMINNKKYHLLIRKVEGKGGISGKLKYKFHYNSNFSTP